MASFKVGMNRLNRLADILDVADRQHRANNEPRYKQGIFVHGCGTPACALGHWAFNNQSRWKFDDGTYPMLRNCDYGWCGDGAVKEFGITHAEVCEIFGSDGCDGAKTAKQAAKYIRKFVKRKFKEAEEELRIISCLAA